MFEYPKAMETTSLYHLLVGSVFHPNDFMSSFILSFFNAYCFSKFDSFRLGWMTGTGGAISIKVTS